MARRPLLPLPDYQRVYQVAYSVLEASEIAITHRACIFFASVGVLILRDQYKLPATFSTGTMAMMVDERSSTVAVYGRRDGDQFVSDEAGFHAWVECSGWLIDFMAPIMGIALREDGHAANVPARMLQKPLAERKSSLAEIQHEGEFFLHHDASLAEALLDTQSVQFQDLVKVAIAWFQKPPKPLRDVALGGNVGRPKRLVVCAPAITGVW